MNELTIPRDPVEGLIRTEDVFGSIQSFADMGRAFLKGAGLAPQTYTMYLGAVRQFYEFTKGLSPLQVRAADIEAFYDHLVERGYDRNTAFYRMAGLKKFFAGIHERIPQYVSPFDTMAPKLKKKLSKFRGGARRITALTPGEIQALLAYLREHDPLNYPIVLMLVTSGLRRAELCGLRWRDLECVEGAWTARFLGKGQKPAEQELYPPAVEATRALFRRLVGSEPKPTDALYLVKWPKARGEKRSEWRALQPRTLWLRIAAMGARARAAGIVDRDLQWSPHLFRRSFATSLAKAGMGLVAIQHLTRHASIVTLVEHYIDDHEPARPYFDRMLSSAPAEATP